MGSSPPPGIRLGTGVEGANSAKALDSSGIFPAGQKDGSVKEVVAFFCLLYACTISPLYSRKKERIDFHKQPTSLSKARSEHPYTAFKLLFFQYCQSKAFTYFIT